MQSTDEQLAMASRALAAGDVAQAELHCRLALELDPRHAPAQQLLGEICRQLGRHVEAIEHVDAALAIDHLYAAAHATLGAIHQDLGQFENARSSLVEALRLDPSLAVAHFHLGALDETQGGLENARRHFAEAIALAPGEVQPRLRLAQVYFHQGQLEAARAAFAETAGAFPQIAWAHCGLGGALHALDRWDEAEVCYRRAIELEPTLAQAHYNLGALLQSLGRVESAIACYQSALRHAPSLLEAHLGLASAFQLLVRPDEATAAARRAIELAPNSGTAYARLGGALQMQGDMQAAIAALRRAVSLDPTNAAVHSNLLYALNFQPDYDPPAVLAEHRAWAARHAAPLSVQAATHDNDRSPHRRLRIGYVSAHFREHAISFFIEPMLAAHDARQVEVFCYVDGRRHDAVTARIRGRAHGWRAIAGLSDAEVAQRVRDDRIDILVDLAGHIGGNRLLVFARKPAPIQVSYLGYQNTTGMSSIDYRLTDARADPPGTSDPFYTERLVRLPTIFYCYQPPDSSPEVGPLPALSAGQVTLASLNHINKLTQGAVAAWSRILRAVPNSRLIVLAYAPGRLAANLQAMLGEQGIDGGRLEVVNKRPRYEYLRLHQQIDVALDTFPVNGHTTVCDALWMGVPSIMLEGDRYAARFGTPALRALGLERLVATSVEQYVETAVQLASDVQGLAELRRQLRERLRGSVLLDAGRFTRELEAAYRQMWQQWCRQA